MFIHSGEPGPYTPSTRGQILSKLYKTVSSPPVSSITTTPSRAPRLARNKTVKRLANASSVDVARKVLFVKQKAGKEGIQRKAEDLEYREV